MPPLLVMYAYLDAETQCYSDVLLCIISYMKKVGLLGSKITVLDYEKSGTRSGLKAVERLTVSPRNSNYACGYILYMHIYVYVAPLHSFLHLHVSSPVDHGARAAHSCSFRFFGH